jgi:uncharacterized protein YpmB
MIISIITLSILILFLALIPYGAFYLFFRESIRQQNHLLDRIQTGSAEKSVYLKQVQEPPRIFHREADKTELTAEDLLHY